MLLAALAAACAPPPPRGPARPPTPASISRTEPGGDSPNPEQAALERLGHEPWGLRSDRSSLVLVPLADANQWRRVRFWLVPALTGFRYGDEHRGVSALFVRPAPTRAEEAGASAACLADFEQWAKVPARQSNVEVGEPSDLTVSWRGQPLIVRRRDGEVLWLLRRRRYASVYASYPAWPGRCATLTYAFPLDQAEAEGRAARERFAREAFGRFMPLNTPPP